MHEVFVSVLTYSTPSPDIYAHTHTLKFKKKKKKKKDVRKNKGFVVMTIAFRLPTTQLQAVLLPLFLEKKDETVCAVF